MPRGVAYPYEFRLDRTIVRSLETPDRPSDTPDNKLGPADRSVLCSPSPSSLLYMYVGCPGIRSVNSTQLRSTAPRSEAISGTLL